MLQELSPYYLALSIFNLLDKWFTYTTINEWKFNKPKMQMKEILKRERNPIARWVMDKWGAFHGMLLAEVFSQAVIFILMDEINEASIGVYFGVGFILGFFVLLTFLHLTNLGDIDEKRKEEVLKLRKFKENAMRKVKG
jgi:hypothetical protein